ncbi:MAG: DUF3592 domain-containing protein [Clostridia bacterium]|nr:DUF3592 domain-containing protein [Clostridia bacterium]
MVIKNKVAIYAFLIVIIALTSVIGTVLLVRNEKKTKGFVRVDAVVVDYKERWDYDDDEMMYCEIVEYTVDGVVYKATNSVWTNAPKRIGKKIEIAYNPDRPSQCVFVKSQNFFSLILFIFSGVCLLALIAQIVMDRKAKRNQSEDNENILVA